jgi:hypothetical protein
MMIIGWRVARVGRDAADAFRFQPRHPPTLREKHAKDGAPT